jgi:two-component system, sensor histidine kinase PdtaS
MENLLLLLPKRPQSIVARYGATTLIVLVCFALQMGVEFQSGMFMFFLLLPGIFLASVLFDRGCGFYATALSTALSIAVLRPSENWLPPPQYLLPFVLFVLVGLALATTSEALRKALEKAVAAMQAADVMLYESNHRIRNAAANTAGTPNRSLISTFMVRSPAVSADLILLSSSDGTRLPAEPLSLVWRKPREG